MLGKVKEAIHNRVHTNNNNGDNEIEIPEAWMLMITKHNRRSVPREPMREQHLIARIIMSIEMNQ